MVTKHVFLRHPISNIHGHHWWFINKSYTNKSVGGKINICIPLYLIFFFITDTHPITNNLEETDLYDEVLPDMSIPPLPPDNYNP